MTALVQEIGFSSPQVCTIVGCSFKQIDYWDRVGLLAPSIASADGSGTQRRYSHRDLLLLLIVSDILDAQGGGRDRKVQRLRAVVEYLRPKLDGDLSDAVVVIVGDRHAFARSTKEIVAAVHSSTETLTVVKLGQLEERIAASILHSFPVVARSVQSSGKSAGQCAGLPGRGTNPARPGVPGAPPST